MGQFLYFSENSLFSWMVSISDDILYHVLVVDIAIKENRTGLKKDLIRKIDLTFPDFFSKYVGSPNNIKN